MNQLPSPPGYLDGALICALWSTSAQGLRDWPLLKKWIKRSGWQLSQVVWTLALDYSYLALLTVAPSRSPSMREMSGPEAMRVARRNLERCLQRFETEAHPTLLSLTLADAYIASGNAS